MKAKGYAAAVISDQEKAMKAFSPFLTKEAIKTVNSYYKNIKSSIKFTLPDGGKILGLDSTQLDKSLTEHKHLPYPIISLEYYSTCPSEKQKGEGYFLEARERVLLCHEVAPGQILLVSFTKVLGVWMPPEAFILYDTKSGLYSVGLLLNKDCLAVSMESFVKITHENYMGELGCLADFLAALSCKNVKVGKIPAPKRTNAKRKKKGKTPLFEYKTLFISAGKDEPPGQGQPSSHASPRLHLRRGHIRRLPTGPIWVNATVVGEKKRGIIHKDYAFID